MRRRQMQSIMGLEYINFLKKENLVQNNSIGMNLDQLERLIDHLLTSIEKAGMSPPKLPPPPYAEEPSHPEYYGRYQWEPENE